MAESNAHVPDIKDDELLKRLRKLLEPNDRDHWQWYEVLGTRADTEMIDGLDKNLDVLLIFVSCLFSQIVVSLMHSWKCSGWLVFGDQWRISGRHPSIAQRRSDRHDQRAVNDARHASNQSERDLFSTESCRFCSQHRDDRHHTAGGHRFWPERNRSYYN